jgi:hypothetical protein
LETMRTLGEERGWVVTLMHPVRLDDAAEVLGAREAE